jgi:hypothetical protein
MRFGNRERVRPRAVRALLESVVCPPILTS